MHWCVELMNQTLAIVCSMKIGYRTRHEELDIWDATFFPPQMNRSDFESLDFVADEIDPLCFNPDYEKTLVCKL